MMSHNRHYVWADVVRSLAIFLVVYIHSRTNFGTTPPLSWIFQIVDLSSAICISLFILLSGALLLPKQEKITTFIHKRLIKIFTPWILWTLIWFLFEDHVILQHSHSYFFILRTFFRFFLSRFWFMPIIFGMYLITPILRIYLVKLTTSKLTIILFLWFLLFIIIPIILLYYGIYNPSNTFLTIFQFLGIYLLGYLIINRYKPAKFLYVWVGLFLIGIFTAFIQLQLWQKVTVARIAAFPYNFLSPEIIVASLGVFIAIYVLFNKKYIKHLSHSLVNLLSNIANAALGIYLTHEFFILLYDKFAFPTYLPFEKTIIVFSLCSIFVISLKKIPYANLLVP